MLENREKVKMTKMCFHRKSVMNVPILSKVVEPGDFSV